MRLLPILKILASAVALFAASAAAQTEPSAVAEPDTPPPSQSQPPPVSSSPSQPAAEPGATTPEPSADVAPASQPNHGSDAPSYKQPSPSTNEQWQQSYGPGSTSHQNPGHQPEPESNPDDGFEMPSFSIRLDPFNWLLEGRLGIELEVAIWKLLSFELVPVFVANDSPPSLGFSGRDDNLYQHSNGLGPISGTSIGLGIWLQGKPFKGYVLRVLFTNYGYIYKTLDDDDSTIDRVEFTERRLLGYFGSHMNFGPFTIAAGIGLGVELNTQQRCFPDGNSDNPATSGCDDEDEQRIALDRGRGGEFDRADLNGWAHPVYLAGRISLGFFFDFD